MLHSTRKDGAPPKCYFTHSRLPAFVDHDQPSQKKKPFSTMQDYPFTHTVDLVLPKEAHESLLAKLGSKAHLQYSQVFMKLSDIVEGDFFKDYVKTGNILMLSEGRAGHDNIFSLRDGTLRLELDKSTYERSGLSGTAIPSGGRKHVKARYALEINLRLPSMVRGKQGFERILWAFKNVLNSRIAWLWHDLKGTNDGTGPIAGHRPIMKTIESETEAIGRIVVPSFPDEIDSEDHHTPAELLEWLGLVFMQSARVHVGDDIDTYLSRYGIHYEREYAEPQSQDVERIRWRGLISPDFVQMIFTAALQAVGKGWFALNCRSFGGDTHMILQQEQRTFTWEFGS